jgi:imidazolonepropionase-like amidohydrolase
MKGAPEGIKFALGENPKQSNWGPGDRYPRTRMGVAEIIRERFVAAKDYRKQQEEFRAGRRAIPPRKDYQLEALLEILDGKRFVHCHSYRQDEILMLIRLAREQGFKVRTFQHVLEGYKIADEIGKSGAGASTFSDWWAYKYEVIDAIPYNGALMHDRGVVVSFNSDSDEQARRLNTEAAKAVRYGNLAEEDALAFVTINPAKQLGVDDRIGSLEAGKDGDFAIWSANPLSQRAICLQTWIEGRRYFDRAADETARKIQAAERAALIEKARKVNK